MLGPHQLDLGQAACPTPVSDPRHAAEGADGNGSLRVVEMLRHGERRFRELIDVLPAAIYTTDAQGRLTYFNPACVELSGRTPEIGSDSWCVTWKLFYADGRPMPHDQCPMALSLKEGRSVHGALAIAERPDGSRIWFEPHPTPLFDDAGNVVGGVNMLVDVTERKTALESQARLAAIVESSADAIISKSLQGIIQSWNAGAQRIFGYTAAEVVGRSIRLLIPPDRQHEEDIILGKISRGERIAHYETVRVAKDGRHIDVSLAVSPVRDASGQIIGASKVARDITERKLSEQALRERQAWLDGQREALEAAVNGAPLKTSLGILVRTAIEAVSNEARAGFYLANDEGTALQHVVGMPPEYAEAVDGFKVGPDSLACGLATATGQPVLTSDVRNEPRWRPWLWMAEKFDYRGCWSFPIHTAARRFVGTLAIYSRQPREATPRDQELGSLLTHTASIIISRHKESEVRKEAEQALRASEERYRQLANLLPVAVYTCDAAGVITYHNQQAARLWGRSPQPGDTDERFCGSEQMVLPGGQVLPHDQCPMALALRDGSSFREQPVNIRRPDGSEVSVRVNIDPIKDASGHIVGAINVFHDVTELHRAEQALRESEERFRMLADNIGQLAWTCDQFGSVTWYNQRWLDYTGLSFEEMQDWGWKKVHHPEHVDRVVASVTRSRESGEIWEDTFPLRGRDGQYRWFLSRAYPIRDQQGQIVRWFGTNTDVTEQRDAEQALQDADARKNEFLSTLAHELRNPLAPIRNSLQLLKLPSGRENLSRIQEMMERQVNHMVRLVDDLLEVSRISRGKIELRKERIELARIVSSALEMSRPLIEAHRHQLSTSLPADTVLLHADPVRLAQVIANLLNNAAKYTDIGGHVWLSARVQGGGIEISVRDTGIGIAPEMLPRVFEMFTQLDRSARPQGDSGLGIGLSLVRNLTELHGGTVEAKSAGLGQGSEFIVRLPLARR